MRCFYFRLLMLISLSVPVLHGALIRVGDESASNIGFSDSYVIVPIEIENNDSGTQYVEFLLNIFTPLFNQIHNFGANTSYATLEEMLIGTTDSNPNFEMSFRAESEVQNQWVSEIQNDGSIRASRTNPVAAADEWIFENVMRKNLFIHAGLLSNTGDSGDYVFGDPSTGLQMAMSANTFFEDYGDPAGVATTTTDFSIPTTLGPDALYVVAIPEPGSLVLVGIGVLAGMCALRTRRRKQG